VSRRHLTFDCEGSALAGTLDEGAATTGLLIVSGGNELRSGAWSGQAQFAAQVAAAGFPVFRYDRRGVGDSEGPNGEFRSSTPDIAAAIASFRDGCPQLTRLVALGNCDAASALMLAKGAGCDALILTNPWTIEDETAAPPPEAIRDHYKRRLASPESFKRLLRGEIKLGAAFASRRL
jgi:exosortase A-associated hydrolase 1